MGKGIALQFKEAFPENFLAYPSKMEYVNLGLTDLVRVIRERGIKSIALPALGCGLGGLDWMEVKQAIEAALAGGRKLSHHW